MVVRAPLLRICRADDDAAVVQREFLDGNFRRACRRRRLFGRRLLGLSFRGGPAQRGIVPLSGAVVQQGHFRTGNRHAGNIQRLRENQRHYFHAHVQRLGRQERSRAEFRVVANGKVFRGKRSADQRQADVAQLHFASQRRRSFLFNDWPELVHGDQERSNEYHYNQHTHHNQHNLQCLIHGSLPGLDTRAIPMRKRQHSTVTIHMRPRIVGRLVLEMEVTNMSSSGRGIFRLRQRGDSRLGP